MTAIRCKIRTALFDARTVTGRWTAFSIQALIIASVVSFSIETLPDLPSKMRTALGYFEGLVVAMFSLEYGLRVWAADRPLRYIFSFYGLVDLAAILPFYLSAGAYDLRTLRLFRILRLLRLLKLARYTAAMDRFRRALSLAKEELIIFSGISLIMLYLSAVGIYYFEHNAQPEEFRSIFDGLWWAVATLTTVGYGDVFPVTAGGRLFTFIVLVVGLGIVAVPTGLLASALGEARRQEKVQECSTNAHSMEDGDK